MGCAPTTTGATSAWPPFITATNVIAEKIPRISYDWLVTGCRQVALYLQQFLPYVHLVYYSIIADLCSVPAESMAMQRGADGGLGGVGWSF